jgi:O-antigen/teichoic acid export membrane protein
LIRADDGIAPSAWDGTAPLTAPEEAVPVPEPPVAPQPTGLVRRIARLLGVDRAIAFTVMARGWTSVAGLVTLTLIAKFLTPAEQGFYYTFYSLVAMQIVFELGFSLVILQAASHEAAHLEIRESGEVAGPQREHDRLASVLKKSVHWYTVAAVLMCVSLIPIGILFFRHAAAKGNSGDVHFVAPWILVVLASTFTFQIDPLFSFLEGCGYVPEVARTRLRQSIAGTALGWSALLLHHGLFAPGCVIFGQAIAGVWFLFSRRRLLMGLLRRPVERSARINWGAELWPFQWRIAVSWLCGYFTYQLFNPILMNYRGAVEAGQMGMSLNVCGTLSAIAIAWMNTKAAPFGRMIARKEYKRLDRVFSLALLQSTSAAVAAFGAVWLVVLWMLHHGVRVHGGLLANRLAPTLPLLLLFAGSISNIIVFGEALYLRAHKQEKFMVNSIMGAMYVVPMALWLGRMHGPHGGVWGISVAYAAGAAVIGLGYGSYTFFKWRRIWHAV